MARTEKEKQLLLRVGGAIRSLRRERKLSQEIFARQAGVGRSYFASVERGENNIAVLNLIKIAATLGVEVVDLLEWENDTTS